MFGVSKVGGGLNVKILVMLVFGYEGKFLIKFLMVKGD